MNVVAVLHVVSRLLMLIGVVMAVSAGAGLWMGDPWTACELQLICAAIPTLTGAAIYIYTRTRDHKYGIREGFGIVAFCWIATGIFGAIPYYVVEDFHLADAIFETVSGFTTTGATIVDNALVLRNGDTLPDGLEGLYFGMRFWHCTTHWIGGMGFVVLSIAILPFLGLGTHNLFRAEVTGPTSSQLTPRIASAAKLFWAVYLMLTVILTVILHSLDLSWYDSWLHACSTLATGGYSTKGASIQAFGSTSVNMVVTLFMYLASISFILHVKLFRGDIKSFFRDEEWRWFTVTIVAAAAVIIGSLWLRAAPIELTTGEFIPATLSNCIEHGLFTVVSLVSTTGFATANFDTWPLVAVTILLLLMMFGGCGSSTSGGLKQSRVLLLFKYAIAQVEYCLFPHAKVNVRFNGARLELSAIYKILGFFVLYVVTAVVFTLVIQVICAFSPVSDKMDLATSAGMLITCLSNVGPAFGNLSPVDTFAWLPAPAKVVLSLAMVVGRLEFFTVLVLFLPSFWKK